MGCLCVFEGIALEKKTVSITPISQSLCNSIFLFSKRVVPFLSLFLSLCFFVCFSLYIIIKREQKSATIDSYGYNPLDKSSRDDNLQFHHFLFKLHSRNHHNLTFFINKCSLSYDKYYPLSIIQHLFLFVICILHNEINNEERKNTF